MSWRNARAGSIGGSETYLRYGPDYMKELGRKGGLLGGRPSYEEWLARARRDEEKARVGAAQLMNRRRKGLTPDFLSAAPTRKERCK
ncbi:MAG: hypothetical protein WC455_15595 [Dehalococcoidia bacterium]|jgi:hypothetical protein